MLSRRTLPSGCSLPFARRTRKRPVPCKKGGNRRRSRLTRGRRDRERARKHHPGLSHSDPPIEALAEHAESMSATPCVKSANVRKSAAVARRRAHGACSSCEFVSKRSAALAVEPGSPAQAAASAIVTTTRVGRIITQRIPPPPCVDQTAASVAPIFGFVKVITMRLRYADVRPSRTRQQCASLLE